MKGQVTLEGVVNLLSNVHASDTYTSIVRIANVHADRMWRRVYDSLGNVEAANIAAREEYEYTLRELKAQHHINIK